MSTTVLGYFARTMAVAGLAAGVAAVPQTAFAQQYKDKGATKIVCWKDKSGKVVGCGDTVPPEYRDAATKELDKQGITRRTNESAAEAEARRAKEQSGLPKEEIERRKRQDSVLLSIYANEKEIDLKRDRELKALDQNITQQQAALKLANERHADATKRNSKEDIARAERDKSVLEKGIAAKEAEKSEVAKRYAEEKKRYMELRGIPQPAESAPAAKPAPATAAAPASTAATAPAKK